MNKNHRLSVAQFLFGNLAKNGHDARPKRVVTAPAKTAAPATTAAPDTTAAPATMAPPDTMGAPGTDGPAADPAAPESAKAPGLVLDPAASKGLEFSAADDETLLKMKADKKSWAEIAEVIKGKGIFELKGRYKKLLPNQRGDAKPAEAPKIDKKGKGKAKEGKGGSKEGKDEGTHEAKGTLLHNGNPRIYLSEKDGMTRDECIELYQLGLQYKSRMWGLLASRWFDKTGKRISPERLPELFPDL